MAAPVLINRLVRKWRLIEPLGCGGQADIYRAISLDSSKEAVVKILLPEHLKDRGAVRAFQNEQDMLQLLTMPSVPRFLATDTLDGRPCFAMEFCRGRTLRQLAAERKPFDRVGCLQAAVGIVAQLHAHEVVHGDIKIENFILAADGHLRLIDFGNARRVRRGTDFITATLGKPRLVGTPGYLAPELLRGRLTSFASDVWALGVLAYYLLAGRPPFIAASREELLSVVSTAPAPVLSALQPLVPRQVSQLIQRCLEKAAKARYENAGEMHAAVGLGLRQFAAEVRQELARILAATGSSITTSVQVDTAVIQERKTTDSHPLGFGGIDHGDRARSADSPIP